MDLSCIGCNNRTGPFLPQGSQKPTPTAKANARSRRFSGEPIPASQNGSEALKKIVLKACAYDPKDRFSSAAEMKEKLEILLYGGVPQDADEATVVGVPRTDGQNMPEERTVGNEVNEKTVYSTPAPSQKEEKILKKKSKVPIWIGGGVAALLAICLIIGGLAQRPKAEKAMEESIPEASEAMVQETVVAETTEPVEDLSPEIQLWIPQQPNHKTIDIGSSHSVGLRQDGTVIAEGNTGLSILNGIEQWQDITAIAAGDDYTVGLKSDGTVVAAGRNGNRECDVDGWSDIIAIDAGYNHTVGLKADGTVVSAGIEPVGNAMWTTGKI